ncbi:rod shape-determining protein MreD [Enterobacteriaceae endosymbiont of Donacia cincticornis]|uniref:rod shape-determining protein MreD n=1 Tax=Enterobacteriaceae endosymbiont of Donacia cincticornis TaxID=2675773 RepID=UPI001449B5D8|nr:rod shape-determining protein MreD [Enterobacteriaceae endosymbiont of Donacia cincticornis]QJC35922.1 rod shape-determining protein MreD [Enterobacteriaceae endosymbiont of Donacia cincticornis]
MKNYFFKLFIYTTFVISLFLQIIFNKSNNIILHIQWLTLILIYWILFHPYKINITTSFFIGLVIDFFTNYILGTHSLLLCIITYFLLYNRKLIINLNLIYKLLFITCILLLMNIIIYNINSINYDYIKLLLQSILNSFIWIIICFYFKRIRFKYRNF